MDINEFVQKRVKCNEELFESEELQIIQQNVELIKKIYLLAIKDNINIIQGGN